MYFLENYTDSETLSVTGEEQSHPHYKQKVMKCTRKVIPKSTTEANSLTQSQIVAKEKGKTLRWNREPQKGDTSAEGLYKEHSILS